MWWNGVGIGDDHWVVGFYMDSVLNVNWMIKWNFIVVGYECDLCNFIGSFIGKGEFFFFVGKFYGFCDFGFSGVWSVDNVV